MLGSSFCPLFTILSTIVSGSLLVQHCRSNDKPVTSVKCDQNHDQPSPGIDKGKRNKVTTLWICIMETWLRVVSVGIFCVSLATAAGNGSSNECKFNGKTYKVGEYAMISYCYSCKCQSTSKGPNVVCKMNNHSIVCLLRKRDTGTIFLYSLSHLS